MNRKLIALSVLAGVLASLAPVASASTVKINFQLRGAPVPPGYFPDYGQAFGPQAGGFSYGWSRNIEADARHRDSANAPDQRYDTLVHLQKGEDAIWEIEVPNGTFQLHVVGGDPSNTDQTNNFDVEGTLIEDPDGQVGNGFDFDEWDVTVEVNDGRLTIKPGAGSSNSKIMWVDITGEGFDQMLGKAKGPTPADGEQGVVLPLFQWTPGTTALLHNVYLGTSPELTEADRVGPSMVAAIYYHAAPLIPGATYYWRVDEVAADMTTVYTGDVWSFTTAFIRASQPVPMNEVKWVDPNTDLSWRPGKGAITHDLYLDTDKAAVEGGTSSVAQKGLYLSTWEPAALAPETTYYWRVDEVTADGTKTVGPVWSFTTLPLIPIADPDLLGWWKMDEGAGATVVDWSGHGRHALFATPAPVWATGYFGGALQFASNGDSAVHADGTFLNGLDALTITAWIKSNVTNTDKGFIIFADPVGDDNQDMRYDAAGGTGGGTNVQKMGIGVAVDAATTTILQLESSNGSQTTDWQFVTLVWKSGQTLQFYIDGKLDAPTANSTAVTGTLTGFSKVIIGRGAKDQGGSWDGLIDEIRVYGRALTAADILLVMRGDPLLAWDPHPANESTTDAVQAVPMTWQAGDQAVRHDVYLGTDQAGVAAADASDATGIYRGRQNGTSFTPSPALEWGQKYFWRVDEVNGDDSISQGFVWSFTVADYLIVDDFESYDDREGTGTRIYETWIDGYVDGSSGSVVGNWDPPFAEQTIVHGGRQSMPLDYNNVDPPYFSEAYREFTPVQNWTLDGLDTLNLWVRGRPVGFVQTASGFTMSGAGTDIWNTTDEFRFAGKPLTGNGTIIARVESIDNTNVWAKAGVMIRENLSAGARYAFLCATPGSGVHFQGRLLNAGSATSDSAIATAEQNALRTPVWVKLERAGTTFNGFYSTDGLAWTAFVWNPQTIAMTNNAYIGLAMTSHSAGVTATAVFSDVTITGNVSGSWQTAEIGVAQPSNGQGDLYVGVEDSAGKLRLVTCPDPAVVTTTTWTPWPIPLDQFTGVNLSKVQRIYIGVGDRDNPQPDGAGRIYIDDIQVIRSAAEP
jgi:hypothetical protein